jgi:hypothetical protein
MFAVSFMFLDYAGFVDDQYITACPAYIATTGQWQMLWRLAQQRTGINKMDSLTS